MKKDVLKLTLVIAIILLSSFAHAQWTQIGSDIVGENGNDRSGTSVSISADGSIVAIGAPYNAGTGSAYTDDGHVRIYQNLAGTWTQMGNDIDGETEDDMSGISVSLSADGTVVAIGAYRNDGNGTDAGHVRIYKWFGVAWIQIGQDIDGEAVGDYSGMSVSLSADGSIVGIGALYNNGNNGDSLSSGHVRVYRDSAGTWVQLGNDIDGEAAGDQSGRSVSLSSDGSIVAIGAICNDGNGTDAGHVRIYQNQSGTWTQIGQDIDGEAAGDNFGTSVSLSSDGSVVAIGAPNNDDSGPIFVDSGHARIYKNVSGSWTQIGTDIDGNLMSDYVGWSVSLSNDGSIVAVGAPGIFSREGYVRIFENIAGTWTQIGSKIEGDDDEDAFGSSVSLSADGSVIAIGANHSSISGTLGFAGYVRILTNPNIGINELNNNIKLSLYPNPTKGKITIKCEKMERVEVLDITGKVLYEQLVSNDVLEIDISAFSKGVYLLHCIANDKRITEKIIIE